MLCFCNPSSLCKWTTQLSFARRALLYVAFGDKQNHCSSRHLLISGGSSAVMEPGHFKVRKSSSQVTRMHFFCSKCQRHFTVKLKQIKWPLRGQKILQLGHPDALFASKRQRRFTVKIKRPDMVTFFFCSHCYRSKAICRARQGGARVRARAVDLPARSFDLAHPGVVPPLLLMMMRRDCTICNCRCAILLRVQCPSSSTCNNVTLICLCVIQGSYRILTVVFQTFPGQNYFFFQTFWGTLFIFMWTKNITKLAFKRWNFLYDVFFYSKYQMGLKFLNSWTSDALCHELQEN